MLQKADAEHRRPEVHDDGAPPQETLPIDYAKAFAAIKLNRRSVPTAGAGIKSLLLSSGRGVSRLV
jgi:hypothetical protein